MWFKCVRCSGAWLEGAGLRKVAERARVDRKTAPVRRRGGRPRAFSRDRGLEAITDELVGAVVGRTATPTLNA